MLEKTEIIFDFEELILMPMEPDVWMIAIEAIQLKHKLQALFEFLPT